MRAIRPGLLLIVLLVSTGCNDPAPTTGAATDSSSPLSQATPAPASNWQVDRDINSVSGKTTVTAYQKYGGNQNIYIRQIGPKLELYIDTDQFLETVQNLNTGLSTVEYKFDDGKVTRQGWHLSANNEALFYPGNPRPFIAKLRKAKTLHFQFKPADTVEQTVSFDVTGLPDVFSK